MILMLSAFGGKAGGFAPRHPLFCLGGGPGYVSQSSYEADADPFAAHHVADGGGRHVSHHQRLQLLHRLLLSADGQRLRRGVGLLSHPLRRSGGGRGRAAPGAGGGPGRFPGRGLQHPELLHPGRRRHAAAGLRRAQRPGRHRQPSGRRERPGRRRERHHRGLHGRGHPHPGGGAGLHRLHPGQQGDGLRPQYPALHDHHAGPGHRSSHLPPSELPPLQDHGGAHREADGGSGKGGRRRL